MIKYTTLHIKNEIIVAQIECEKIAARDWETNDAGKYKIISPIEFQNEIWYSFALYDTEERAKAKAIVNIRYEMERSAKINKTLFLENEFFKKATAIITRKLK